MFIAILHHTPTWVWGLLALLIALGLSQSFPHSVPLRRTTVLPLVLLGLSLQGVLTTFAHHPLALLAWTAGLAAAALAWHGRVDLGPVRFDTQTRRFDLPGSWLPLVLILALFVLKFGVGVSLAMTPALRQSEAFALTVSLAYGLFTGTFLVRAVALWSVARQALQTRQAGVNTAVLSR